MRKSTYLIQSVVQALAPFANKRGKMDFTEYQIFTRTTAVYPEFEAQEYLMYGLMSEVGELAALLKREIRDEEHIGLDELQKELGDVLWYLARLADTFDLHLNKIAQCNVDKLSKRKYLGMLQGKGDRREEVQK